MISFESIPKFQVSKYVTIAFQGDDDLINVYHVVNGDFDKCVFLTCKNISDTDVIMGFEYFGIYNNEQVIGYTVIGPALLFSFGINIKYRNKEVLMAWWQWVCAKMNLFKCVLWKKNTRAIAFLVKNGMQVEKVTDDHVFLIKN